MVTFISGCLLGSALGALGLLLYKVHGEGMYHQMVTAPRPYLEHRPNH